LFLATFKSLKQIDLSSVDELAMIDQASLGSKIGKVDFLLRKSSLSNLLQASGIMDSVIKRAAMLE